MTRREYAFFFLCFLSAAFLISWIIGKRRKISGIPVFAALSALILRALYIWYTPTWVRQHDVIGFGNSKGIGQAALIEWFYERHCLPDFDPSSRWGFFQPPLHHILSAAWLKLNTALSIPYAAACENIQILTLIYSLSATCFSFLCLRQAGLKGRFFNISAILCALHPIYILLSGSVNNDMLCALLMIMTAWSALEWYRNGRFSTLIFTALCMGLSMMAKLSGVLTAPAVAFLLLKRLYAGGLKELWKNIREYLVFGIISIPLGMFFPLRNLILYGIPLNYTPEVGESVEGHSLISRFLDVRTSTPFACMIKNGDSYDEFNIPLAMIKTSLTGETSFLGNNQYILIPSWALFISGAALAVMAFVFTLAVICGCFSSVSGKSPKIPDFLFTQARFWSIIYVTGLIFFFNLALSIPNFSSQDFRYIAHLILPEAIFSGWFLMRNPARAWTAAFVAIEAVFALSSASVYFLLGLP